jgi:hypothetical protein
MNLLKSIRRLTSAGLLIEFESDERTSRLIATILSWDRARAVGIAIENTELDQDAVGAEDRLGDLIENVRRQNV